MSEIHNYLESLYSCIFPEPGALENDVVPGRESTPMQAKGGGIEVAEDSYGTLPKINTNIIEGKIHTWLLRNEELGLRAEIANIISPTELGM